MRANWMALPPEPWKNGGGVTRTLAADPAGRWRVSIADIDRDGPYSRFPGHDRISVVLSGAGVSLRGEGVAVALRPRAPTAFAGDDVLQSRLADGRVRVLNLFVLRGSARALVARLDAQGDACDAGSLADVAGDCQATRLIVATGRGLYAGPAPDMRWTLAAGEFLLLQDGAAAAGVPAAGDPAAGDPAAGVPAADASSRGTFVPDSHHGFAICLDIAVAASGRR